MAKVTVLFGNDPQGEYTLEQGEHTVGRSRDCSIVIDNLGVSRHHCSIVQDGSDWKVVDKGSNNGTFLNGAQVEEHQLKHDDRIVLGKYSLVFDAHGYSERDEDAEGQSAQAAGMGAEMTMFVDPDAIKQMQEQMQRKTAQQSKPDAGTASEGPGNSSTTSTPAPDRFVLSVMQGTQEAKIQLFRQDVAIGKGPDNDVPIKGLLVKPLQAKVMKTESGWRLMSFGGWRSVKVNDVKIVDAVLKHGDRIEVAGTFIVFKKA